MHIDKIIEDKIQNAVSNEINDQLDRFLQEYLNHLPKPEYESWGRYLTLKQAMIYTGYSSKGGLDAFLKKHNIKKIKNSPKDVKIDREDIDDAMIAQQVASYKKQLKISS